MDQLEGSMRILTVDELDFVSGGLTDKPKSLWDRFVDFMSNIGGGGSSAPTMGITGAELGELQRNCRDSGGNFSFEQTGSASSANMRVVNADGSESFFKVTCTD